MTPDAPPLAGGRLRLARTVLRANPFLRGRWRLAALLLTGSGSARAWPRAGARVVASLPDGEVVACRYGLRMRVFADPMYRDPYLFGDYERSESDLLRRLVRPGDVVLDVGAGFGWYAALLAKRVEPGGRVHAFEPLPASAEVAAETLRLNGAEAAVTLNRDAVGAASGTLSIHTFEGLPRSHASSSTLGRADARAVACPVTTVDDYVAARGIARIHLLKLDVEGHELEVLRGASATLSDEAAPVLAFEVNPECLADRGHAARDLEEALRAVGYTGFWTIRPKGGAARAREGLAAEGDYLAAKPCLVPRVTAVLRGRWASIAS